MKGYKITKYIYFDKTYNNNKVSDKSNFSTVTSSKEMVKMLGTLSRNSSTLDAKEENLYPLT